MIKKKRRERKWKKKRRQRQRHTLMLQKIEVPFSKSYADIYHYRTYLKIICVYNIESSN